MMAFEQKTYHPKEKNTADALRVGGVVLRMAGLPAVGDHDVTALPQPVQHLAGVIDDDDAFVFAVAE